ncbi:hypothetical protein EX30DRAFT_396379 [Ascodesmis nigricans]|uniref:Uncharacterized protein n=1 Tax=Ascodesmis nigricans TaxID=341454 RepID=A0A4V3SIJ4_9PEZI|nr:hypothetical protein EX30DRAFT_396379 [Ascodesmis nigricans]
MLAKHSLPRVLLHTPTLRPPSLALRASVSTSRSTTSSTAFLPVAIPNPLELDFLSQPRERPIRVPFLPDNDLSRHHRHEYVPRVAPPHVNPLIEMLSNSPNAGESRFVEVARGVVKGLVPDHGGEVTKMEAGGGGVLGLAAAGVWWVGGEGVMIGLGIL